ncbi:hypothetical protein K8I61_09555 [bacterium]|nr:hypothetical protein [bacterium]
MLNIGLVLIIVFSSLISLTIVITVVASVRRRRDALPPDMLDGELPDGPAARGFYLGTYHAGGDKPFSAQGFLNGGPGVFYTDGTGVNFLIDGSRQPVHIPFTRLSGTETRKLTRGKHHGEDALHVTWTLDGKSYRSVFVPADKNVAALAAQLNKQADGP